MNLILKIKENLGIICIGLFFASLWSVNKYTLAVLEGIFYTLIGFIAIIGGFLAVMVITDFVKKFETYKEQQKTNLQNKISNSIDNEKKANFDKLEEKMNICRDRITLYEDLSHVYSLRIVKLIILATIFLVLGILSYLFFPENEIKISLTLAMFFTTLYFVFTILFVIYDMYNH
ncbi:hypothetical protein J4440_04595 [Candidatus Woesearchaeota archaeon]|nr:hypothetical protein [Candidatus Woesearchaeota archaeon]